MLSGTARVLLLCQPAPSSTRMACAPGATLRAIPAGWAFIAAVLTKGRTRPAAAPRPGQTAPKREPVSATGSSERSNVHAYLVSRGARGRLTALRPDPGERALLACSGFILEPDFKRFARGGRRDCGSYRLAELFLKRACASGSGASGSDFGCCGHTDRRR